MFHPDSLQYHPQHQKDTQMFPLDETRAVSLGDT